MIARVAFIGRALRSRLRFLTKQADRDSKLEPTQKGLPRSVRKSPEKYIKNGVTVEIHFIRSSRQPDNRTTDDEFVPYLFNDGKLVGIGWILLGGPTTRGQKTPKINIQEQDTSIVF